MAELIGWPKYDLKRHRFAVSNAVWEHKLKPVEFVIFSYLCCHTTSGVLTPEMIAAEVHMTVGTVKKYLSALVSKGLITNKSNLAQGLQHISNEKFFTLPNEIFLLKLPPSALEYCVLLQRRRHTCWDTIQRSLPWTYTLT